MANTILDLGSPILLSRRGDYLDCLPLRSYPIGCNELATHLSTMKMSILHVIQVFTLVLSLSHACEKFLQIETYDDANDCQARKQAPAYTYVWGLDCCINYVEGSARGQMWSVTQNGDQIDVQINYYRTADCQLFVGGDNYTYSASCDSTGKVGSIVSTPTASQLYDGESYMSKTYVTTEQCMHKDMSNYTLQYYYKMNECVHVPNGNGYAGTIFTCSSSKNVYNVQNYVSSDCVSDIITEYEYTGQHICRHNPLSDDDGIIWECSEP